MELIFKGAAVLAAFITLIYTASSNRRAGEKHQIEMLKAEIEILEKLSDQADDTHYQRMLRRASSRAENMYRDFKPYYPVYFRVGLYIYVGFSLIGFVLMYSDQNIWWSILCYVIAMGGFEMQRRGLTPNMSGNPDLLKLKGKNKI